MKIIGLTGGIASGKSLVSTWLVEHGVQVLDTDLMAREVVAKGSSVLEKLTREFGADVLADDGTLNRVVMARIAFNDNKNREKMNKIIHPAILQRLREETGKAKQQKKKLICWDVPLLIDLGWQRYVDFVWVVKAHPMQQINRMMLRDGFSKSEAKLRLQAQLAFSERAKFADEIIDNTDSIEKTKLQLENILQRYRRLYEV